MNNQANFLVCMSDGAQAAASAAESSLHDTVFSVGLETLDQRLRELGLSAHVEHDFAELGAFLRAQGSFVNPTYDPQHSDLSSEDFWLRVVDSSGVTVACSAERTVETDDFSRLVARGTIWYRSGFAAVGGPAEIPVLPQEVRLAGRIGASGSTYTVQAWRRHGLALVMTWYTRLLSFRDLRTTANTGFVRHSLARTSVPSQSYAYDRIEKIIDGYFPPQRGAETLYLCSIDQAGMARRVLGLPRHPTNPMRLGATVSPPLAA
jgi:hypothetical protein